MDPITRLQILADQLDEKITAAVDLDPHEAMALTQQYVGLQATIGQLQIEDRKATAATVQARALADLAMLGERFVNGLAEDGGLHVITHAASHLALVKS